MKLAYFGSQFRVTLLPYVALTDFSLTLTPLRTCHKFDQSIFDSIELPEAGLKASTVVQIGKVFNDHIQKLLLCALRICQLWLILHLMLLCDLHTVVLLLLELVIFSRILHSKSPMILLMLYAFIVVVSWMHPRRKRFLHMVHGYVESLYLIRLGGNKFLF